MGIWLLLEKGRVILLHFEGLHFEGLRKKIILNYFKIIIITVVLFEALFIFYIKFYYYNSVEQSLLNKASYTYDFYSKYMASDNLESKLNHIYSKEISNKNFEFAVQVIDNNYNMIIDQYGFSSDKKIQYEDVKQALKDKIYPYVYTTKDTKEHVMSVSVPLKVNNKIEGLVRYTVSLENIDITIIKIIAGLILAGIIILGIALSLSLKFANTLVVPLRELKVFANELAHGNYNIKLKNRKISDDEIGELGQTFEYMAEEIDKSEKLKDEFISSVSHELRTPLTSIKGWSETLSYGATQEELDLGLGIIQDETDRLINLVEELLDFSRLSSDRIKLQVDIVNLYALLRDTINQFRIKVNERNINLSLDIDGDLKNIQGDKNRLKQVLINLLQNSLKFTKENGYIVVKVYQDEDYTYIKVIDNGEGISKANLEKVFDKFFQENYNKSGSGLGLAISNEIVKLHEGEMNIESVKDIGTTVTVKIINKLLESV